MVSVIHWWNTKMRPTASFETLIAAIDDEIVHRIFKIQVEQQQMPPHQHVHENTPPSEVSEGKIIKQSSFAKATADKGKDES